MYLTHLLYIGPYKILRGVEESSVSMHILNDIYINWERREEGREIGYRTEK
jgi:hypothetical protein